ncbi:MAG: UDP-N-acetyl-D-glucosamine dehydrogenase [Solirubrobacteraceae bacterium]|nr:UDP-N-acetyl-D-glucosamine dehydrogenase [Solirubrobacteraceae bacterium]
MSIGIVGLGYVGLPLAVAFAEAGHDVVALDVDNRKITAIREGRSYIADIPSERLQSVVGRIEATTRPAALAHSDAVLICVPTPLTANREPDLGPLLDAGQALAGVLQAGQLVVLESTTYPGTTRERLLPLLEESGLAAGRDFNLAFSPERVDPGRTDFTLRNTPKIVGGLTPACTDRAVELYEIVCDDVIRVSTPEVAEMSKLLENIFRSVNIALVNELAILADRMGIDIWEVVEAAASKPYGFMRFEPGPGMGGHCLPVDPFYLSWRARQFDMSTEFIELAGKINQQMPYHCVQRVERALNDAGKPVRGSKVALIGVSYKTGVGDMREAPALKIMGLLSGLGADLHYHDPYVPELREPALRGESLEDVLEGADVAVIVTAHPDVDHQVVVERAPLVVDLRGVTRGLHVPTVQRL